MIDRGLRLSTPRLTLRPFEPADAPRLVEIQSNWNVTRMLRLAPWPPTPEAMVDWVDIHGKEWRAGAAYRFACVMEGEVIGCADIDAIASGGAELGYFFDEAHWGKGLAREAAGAVRDFAFRTIGLDHLIAGHAAENPASGRVLLALGFRHAGDTMKSSKPHGGRDVAYRLYRLEKAWP
ncbi:GNAT family N-acetyltransferase [Phenylobacterium sp.]|uniref:GNAT family N-acetyltransferase n=1 Tax=Phenylobacterium sp. TaxID=1871053 RepID=UPI002732A9F6|nr:GNAT family N-acetyltransferase [Phenylobacterium sp.]MDP3853526.1 GNAT family N-acetyltransferase [Phenylobacterium sp.]